MRIWNVLQYWVIKNPLNIKRVTSDSIVIHLWVSQWKEFQDYWLRFAYIFQEKNWFFLKPIPEIIPILQWVITSSMCMYWMYRVLCNLNMCTCDTTQSNKGNWLYRLTTKVKAKADSHQWHISVLHAYRNQQHVRRHPRGLTMVTISSSRTLLLDILVFQIWEERRIPGKNLSENMYNTVMVHCRGVPFTSISWFEIKLRYCDSKYCFWVKCGVS